METHLSNSIPLDEILYRLLFDSDFCKGFVEGRWQDLPIATSDYQYLRGIDTHELGKMVNLIRRDVLNGTGGGNLMRSFPKTFKTLTCGGNEPEVIVDRFLGSPQFRQSSELPFAGRGLSIEEAFYDFVLADQGLSSQFATDLPWPLHECLSSLFAILVTSPLPNFDIRLPLVRKNAACRYALSTYKASFVAAIKGRTNSGLPEPECRFLYAAAKGCLIQGPIPALAADIIAGEEQTTDYGSSYEQTETLRHKLSSLGLISV